MECQGAHLAGLALPLPLDLRTFEGEREIFVVQVNVDPEGETLSRAEKARMVLQDSLISTIEHRLGLSQQKKNDLNQILPTNLFIPQMEVTFSAPEKVTNKTCKKVLVVSFFGGESLQTVRCISLFDQ